jgi:CopG family nickel-responsive transcriptional regulator
MSDLVRFGVAMDRALLSEFDKRIAARGYENRSEALRDLIRADLTRAAWDGGAMVAATLTIVYDNHVRELVTRIVDLESAHLGLLVSSLRVPLRPERSLEVMVVRGAASDLATFEGRLGGIKGVLSCELTVAASLLESTVHEGLPRTRDALPRPADDRSAPSKPVACTNDPEGRR